jgi:hypothetical protein
MRQKFTNVSEVFLPPSSGPCLTAFIIDLMMEAVRTPETSVNPHQSTRLYDPEDSHLHTHRRENLKSYSDVRFPTLRRNMKKTQSRSSVV